MLDYAKPSLLIADEPHAALAADWDLSLLTHGGLFAAADGESNGDGGTPAELTEDATHVVFFTSGSTGRPKGVVLSHRANWLRSLPGQPLGPRRRHRVHVSAVPHVRLVDDPERVADPPPDPLRDDTGRADPAGHRGTTPRHAPVSHPGGVATCAAGRSLRRTTCRRVRECDTGTSATPPELLAAIKDAFPGTVTRIYYGSTEVGLAAMLADADIARKPGSVGPPALGVSLALVDGEVCVRSPFLMDGYFEHPEANAEALAPIEPGGPPWYHTGDLGVLDDEGYLAIVGRARDVLRHRRRDRGARRGRGRARDPSRHRGRRGRRLARHRVGRGDHRRGRPAAPGHPPRASNSSARTARTGSRGSSSPAASRQSTSCLAPRRRARSSARCSSSASRPATERATATQVPCGAERER